MIGDDTNASVPMVLDESAFAPFTVRAKNLTIIHGVGGHGATPVVLKTGPHNTREVDTDDVTCRPLLVFPCELAAIALAKWPSGTCSLQGFFAEFLEGKWDSADDAVRAEVAVIADWFRAASTQDGAGVVAASVETIAAAGPRDAQALRQWTSAKTASDLAVLGHGGPGLTNAAFTAGIADVTHVVNAVNTSRMEFDRQQATKTFADKHGASLEQLLLNYTDQITAADLPEVHTLLVNAPKGREHAILLSLFSERSASTTLPITEANMPVVSTKLLDTVFRQYAPGGTGLSFGEGLTPFAIVCEGHKDVAQVKALTKKAAMVEGGSSVSLQDAESLVAYDVRMPTEAYVAIEKLYGWSVVVDVFHGVRHPVATTIRSAVATIGPCLHRVASQMADAPRVGMELVCRVLFELQQEYFYYLRALAHDRTKAPPDFHRIITAVETFRVDSLSPLPAAWYAIYGPVQESRTTTAASTGDSNSPRDRSGTVSVSNPNSEARLLSRYRDSDFSTLTSMVADHKDKIPKVAGKEVCLSWAFKGVCNTQCKRKSMHNRYSRETVQKLHELMDACGVADSQP
jgi:hypothetical protein